MPIETCVSIMYSYLITQTLEMRVMWTMHPCLTISLQNMGPAKILFRWNQNTFFQESNQLNSCASFLIHIMSINDLYWNWNTTKSWRNNLVFSYLNFFMNKISFRSYMVWLKNQLQLDQDLGVGMGVNHGMMEFIQESSKFISQGETS